MQVSALRFTLDWISLGYTPGTREDHYYDEEHEKWLVQNGIDPRNPNQLFEFLYGMKVFLEHLEEILPYGDVEAEIYSLASEYYHKFLAGLGYFIPEGGLERGKNYHLFHATPFSKPENWVALIPSLADSWGRIVEFLEGSDGAEAIKDSWAVEDAKLQQAGPIKVALRCEDSYCRLLGQNLIISSLANDPRLHEDAEESILRKLYAMYLMGVWPYIRHNIRLRIQTFKG